MSKILISGYYGFSNAGDEAMLTAIIEALRAERKDVEITVMSGKPEVTAKKHGVRSIHRFSPLQILKAMLHTDLLLSGGGSLLQEAPFGFRSRQVKGDSGEELKQVPLPVVQV